MKVYISKNRGFDNISDNLYGYAYCGENHCIGFIIFVNGKYHFDQCSNHLSFGRIKARPVRKIEKLQHNIEKAIRQDSFFFVFVLAQNLAGKRRNLAKFYHTRPRKVKKKFYENFVFRNKFLLAFPFRPCYNKLIKRDKRKG